MATTIKINLTIEIQTNGEEATRDTDAAKLTKLSLFVQRCNALADALTFSKGKLSLSAEDIEDAYPTCYWYGKMTFRQNGNFSFLDANRLLNMFQNFSSYYGYHLLEATAKIVE